MADDDDLDDDQEEHTVGEGTTALHFLAPVEVLPQTARTEWLQKQKEERRRRRIEEREERRKQKEADEAKERRRKAQQKEIRQQKERERELQDRRRREEEEQREKMEGGLGQIIAQLQKNESERDISFVGIDLGSVQVRLLAKALENNTTCESIDLSRKGLNDEDGVALAEMLKVNRNLRKLELEGNNLSIKSAKALAEALMSNATLRMLDLESNNITSAGNDQTGVVAFADALKQNHALRCLNLVRNHVTHQGGDPLVQAMAHNTECILLDLSGNELHPKQLRDIDVVIQENRKNLSKLRRAERRERFAMFTEQYRCRQYDMQVEAKRIELDALEERRLHRQRERFVAWQREADRAEQKEAEEMARLQQEHEDRVAAGGKKKKGKRK